MTETYAVPVPLAVAVGLLAVPLFAWWRRAVETAVWRDAVRITELTGAAGVAELAGWVDEEVGNPVASLLNNVSAVHRLIDRGDEAAPIVSGAIDEARSAGEQIAQVIRRLRLLVGAAAARREPIQLNDIARESVRLGRWHAGLLRVRVDLALHDALPPVRGDPEQLLEVALCLVMAGVTAASTSADHSVRVATARADDGVVLTVADSGRPVSERDRSQLFAPFSRVRAGGISLFGARSIVEFSGGHLTAERPTSGSLFRVSLPADLSAAGLERAS